MLHKESNSMAENESPSPPPPVMLPSSSSDVKFSMSGSGGRPHPMFKYQQKKPAQFLVPLGLDPKSFLHSPGSFTPSQGQQIQSENPSSSAAPPPIPNHNIIKTLKPTNFAYEKPLNVDGFIWDWYRQRQEKGCPFPRTHYKCRHADCPAQKRLERAQDGQITEIIYEGRHNHPTPPKPAQDNIPGQESNLPQHLSGSSNCEDEPEPKKRRVGDDGYRWIKYGEKVLKGSPYPRSYYKCTNYGCQVRKQVERDANEERIRYEGEHNHEVPASKKSSRADILDRTAKLRLHS